MYLKSLELVGFKSFADRTRLHFEPGMTAIVGPNGCGKSNVADAVRWVLGEQSAKALRGSCMEDCIFNGTDSHKPMGMAEVSLTFADCEKILGTEFNEVTVTRRVFRSGEGQYFMNKTPCRLKDIQRLFMDTGIGTDSYSILEQGRIDQILSSRPEDRREVFEEASGITKFKADKKEAIRKLEQTEANLLRLADIIREVKRQIISLQRQAGKARRYKELQQQLRGLDIFATRERLQQLDAEVRLLETRLASLLEQEEALRADAQQTEQEAARNREALSSAEAVIAETMESSMRARTELGRARELIRVNEDRVHELQDLCARDSRDAQEARDRLEQHRQTLAELGGQREAAAAARDAAEREFQEHAARLAAHEERAEAVRRLIHELGSEAIDVESRLSRLQNELYDLEAGQRTTTLRRERLAAERAELQHTVEQFQTRQTEMSASLGEWQTSVGADERRLKECVEARQTRDAERAAVLKTLTDARTRRAAREAQVELLSRPEARTEGFAGGARHLLEQPSEWASRGDQILGALAEHIRPAPDGRLALEAALRAWLDAVVVSDEATAQELLVQLRERQAGAARLLPLAGRESVDPWPNGPGTPLADHVECASDWRPAVRRLLTGVRLVDRLDAIADPLPPGAVLVTPDGMVRRANGLVEYWMPEAREITPLARQDLLRSWNGEMTALAREVEEGEQQAARLRSEIAALETEEAALRAKLDEGRRQLAQREGENHIISQEAEQARQRAETVAWEWQAIQNQQASGNERQAAIHGEMAQLQGRQKEIREALAVKNDELRRLDQERAEKSNAVTESRVHFAERRQAVEHLAERERPLLARIAEIEELIRARSEGLETYRARIQDLEQQAEETRQRIAPLEEEVQRQGGRLDEARRQRDEKVAALSVWDAKLREQRAAYDEARSRKSQADIELAEQRVRRQNMVERVAMDYRITPEQLAVEPEPAWENGQRPDRETLETMIAELRAKLESMGPVNLVAIEEHQQLEERFSFLTRQQEDLVNAKQQLMDLIRRINQTTTEMFSETFRKVNESFQQMFHQLFGGGSAKLVLVDETDVLESGIEIIARPPGKKLQAVSLLSGGERTMCAVALLFALYLVKPSPFCLLDELDAALDESNIVRFVKVVQGFLANSQFIVITHNRHTIGAADILYGVTMEQQGVSKIVSVKFSSHKAPPAPAPSGELAPAETAAAGPAPEDPAKPAPAP